MSLRCVIVRSSAKCCGSAESGLEALSSLADSGPIRCALRPDRGGGCGREAVARKLGASRGSIVSLPRGVTLTATVAQAETAFTTTIAASPDGSVYANISDPQIPLQFGGVIGSIVGLDNLRHSAPMLIGPPRPRSSLPAASLPAVSLDRYAPIAGAIELVSIPAYSSGLGDAFGPADLYTFYNETPLINAGISGGGGDCLAVAEDSDYLDSAAGLFSSNFGLPAPSLTRVLPDTTSPGINGDEIETLADIEWAHAVAPGAPIRVYIGNGLVSGDPLLDAISKAVTDNTCGAISISFSFCGATPLVLHGHTRFGFRPSGCAGSVGIHLLGRPWGGG